MKKTIKITKEDLGIEPTKIKRIEKVDIFEEYIELHLSVEDGNK